MLSEKNTYSIDNRKRIIFVSVITAAVVLVLSFFVGYTIRNVQKKVIERCYEELESSAVSLCSELYFSIEANRSLLNAVAALVESRPDLDKSRLSAVLNSAARDSSYISCLELLNSKGEILDSDGHITDVSSLVDFSEEAKKGNHLSEILPSIHDPRERIIRNAVNIEIGGKVKYILYGVTKLSTLAERFQSGIYSGKARVFILNGNTGEFLMDTWNEEPGIISDFADRAIIEGSWEAISADIKNGRGGRASFISKLDAQVIYMHYEPVGVNNLSVLVMVERDTAFADNSAISKSLYIMAAMIGAVMLVYLICVSLSIMGAYRQVSRMWIIDQGTGIKNRNAFHVFVDECKDKVFPSLVCIYVDANGLHEINNRFSHASGDAFLSLTAEKLKNEFGSEKLFRIGGDEFVIFETSLSSGECESRMKNVEKEIISFGCSISYGIVSAENETGIERVTREADELMLKNKDRYYRLSGKRGR